MRTPSLTDRRTVLLAGLSLPAVARAAAAPEAPAVAPPAPTPPLDPSLAALAVLAGEWAGRAEGRIGNVFVTRSYASLLRGRFLMGRTAWSAPLKAEVLQREDVMLYGLDDERRRMTMSLFDSEGFVHHFVAQTVEFSNDRIVFETDTIEGYPPSPRRVRQSIVFVGPDAFDEIVETARPNEDFDIAMYSRLVRS